MHKILQGVRDFQNTVFLEQREFFETLGFKQQTPRALFITCSDSRINPNLVTSTEPGELFVLRNAGNIIPPYGAQMGGESATIEYAVSVLNLKHVILCGHYHCGAVQTLLNRSPSGELPAVEGWFNHAEAARRIVKTQGAQLSPSEQQRFGVEQNVLVQINNLRTHPCISVGMASGELQVHAWTYRIETGEVLAYRADKKEFIPLVEREPTPVPFVS